VVLLPCLCRQLCNDRCYLVGPQRDHSLHAHEEITLLSNKLQPSLALYIILIIVGLFVPLVAVLGYLVLAFLLIVPIKLLRRQRAESVVGQGAEGIHPARVMLSGQPLCEPDEHRFSFDLKAGTHA
jgi:hypothetical protein